MEQKQIERILWLIICILLIASFTYSLINFSRINERMDKIEIKQSQEITDPLMKQVLVNLKNPKLIKENISIKEIGKTIIFNKNNIPLVLNDITYPLEEIEVEKIKDIEISEKRFTYKIKAYVYTEYSGNNRKMKVTLFLYKDNLALEKIVWS